MTDEIKRYFLERYEKASFRVVPGHWPDFESREAVDRWIEAMEATLKVAQEEIRQEPKSTPDRCPFCGAEAGRVARSFSDSKYYVLCSPRRGGCSAKGPERTMKESAIRAWNRRNGT